VVGDFRTDIPGLETAGLDRIDRRSNGLDGLFIVSNTGQEIWKENRSDRGCYGTIIDMVENWDSIDRLVAWKRGCQKPYVYNGSGSVVSTFSVSGGRVMHANVCGDYHEEMFLYVLGDRVEIYSNGGACDLTQTTGSPLPQIKRLYNYTRYTAGETPVGGGPTPTQVPPTQVPPTQVPGGPPYQAENATLGGGVSAESNHSGYNGSGFVNFPSSGGYVEYQNVDGGSGGSATLQFRFALGATSSRTGRLTVNGASQNITFDPTGAWDAWAVKEVVVTLNSGTNNTIRLESTGQDLANQDQMEVAGGGPAPTTVPPTAIPPTSIPPTQVPGAKLALDRPASADSEESSKGNVIENGNDGSTSTRWCAADGQLNHWWQVDLGASYNLTGSEVMWEFSGRVYDYRVEVSTNGSTWTTVTALPAKAGSF
jgi:hypothetical protein